MNILAVDTSGKTASVAVIRDGESISEFFLNNGLVHSRTLVPIIESTLKHAEIFIDSIDLFAVTIGPGSFTGIRIGMSFIKGMMFALNKPCVGVSSLEVMAHNIVCGSEYIVCPCTDMRRGTFYNSIFKSRINELERLTPDRRISTDDLLDELKEYSNNAIYFVGDGAQICYNSWINNSLLKKIFVCENIFGYIKASCLGKIAYDKYIKDSSIAKYDVYPSYISLSQAQEKLKQKSM